MGRRGRNAKSDTQKLETIRKDPPKPLEGMEGTSVDVWNRIVNSMAATFFKPHQYDLLKAYCEAVSMREEALAIVNEQGFTQTGTNGMEKVNPHVDVVTKCNTTMATLSTKLGLNANSSLQLGKKKSSQAQPAIQNNSRAGLMFGGKDG